MTRLHVHWIASFAQIRADTGAVAVTGVSLFNINTRHVSKDTTSRIMYGDYDLYEDPKDDHPFEITHGFSKRNRPDLKRLVHSMLCVDHGIPIYMKCESGNAWTCRLMRTFSNGWWTQCTSSARRICFTWEIVRWSARKP